MKLCRIMIVLLIAVLLFSACNSRENKELPYHFEEKNGQTYICFDDTEFIGMGNYYTEEIFFQSWGEILPKIQNGDFTEEEMNRLRCWYQAYGPFPMPTLSEAPLAACPDGYERMEFAWLMQETGMTYQIYYGEGDNVCSVSMRATDPSNGGIEIENIMVISDSSGQLSILSTEEDPQRNATIYYIKSMFSDGIVKYAIYSYESNGNVYYVRERYEEKESVPSDLRILIHQADDQYVILRITNPQECPTKEWLNQFGLVSDN